MSDDRWARLTDLYHSAVAMTAEERASFLADECADDASLRAGVERLVAAHERANQLVEALEPVAATAIPSPGVSLGDAVEPEPSDRQFGPYRVVRELGRGGMGIVYLGERADGHDGQVAIKLIERPVDSDLFGDRLRAERRIMASLDHPNIGRLLDGGTTEEGFPYFIMEYVDGEPLDEYADAYRLSVPDRLKLFLQVTSAVAQAHRYQIVHRDIKPANVLVTPSGLPKVVDFGIANVLDPDGDDQASSDLRVLTPEYASPEQVEGRRATSASDVYSLGVVLYELLTGHSPYQVRTREPLEVSQAVRTIDPERPSKAVTRDVEVIEPGKRRAGLAEDRAAATSAASTEKLGRRLRGDLDAIVLKALRKVPAQRYQSVEQLAADVRLHLDGRPVSTQADNVTYRTGKFIQRNRTSLFATVLLSVLIVGIGGGLVAYRANARPPEPPPPLGLLAARDRVVVADLTDGANDPSLATALSDAFRVDLTQSPYVQVVSDRPGRAARDAVKAVVTGAIERAGGGYTITAQLMSAEKRDVLVELRETAVDSTDVIRALGRLSQALRSRMGESSGSIQATPPLEQVTTSSLPALREYSDGIHAITGANRARGLQLLDSAIALDTGFASAYRMLGLAYSDMGETGRATAANAHAVANQSRLAFYERYHTIGSHAYNVQHDNILAIDAYQRILERWPNDVRALTNLSYVYSLRREYAVQESLLVRALAVDSSTASISTALAVSRVNRGNFTGARLELDRIENRYPNLSSVQLAEIYFAAAQQDWPTAERWARSRLALRADDTPGSADALETLAGILMTQGRLTEAAQQSRAVLTLGPKIGSPGRYLSSAIRLGDIDVYYHNAPTRARVAVNAALARYPLDRLPENDRPYDRLARFFVAAGDAGRARELILRADQTTLGRQHIDDADRRWTLGVISLAKGQFPEAVAQLRVAAEQHECPVCALPDLARAYEAVGKPDSAIAVYERYLHEPWERRYEIDATALASSTRRLAELYELRRETAKAADQYAALVNLWNRADPELASMVEDVRKQLAKLGVATGQRD